MTEKDKLLSFLNKAKSDYELSISYSQRFFVRKKFFRKLGTHYGLTTYFEQNFNCNPVWLHLNQFKPVISDQELIKLNIWFPIGKTEGFESRLRIINLAIEYYLCVNESEVPFLPLCDSMSLVCAYIAFESGSSGNSDDKIYSHIFSYYDEYLDRSSDEG